MGFNNYTMNPNYQKIGGWLIFILIQLILMPINILNQLINDSLPMYINGTYKVFTTPGSEVYNSLWLPYFVFETLGNTIFAIFIIVVLILFLKKKKVVPYLMIALVALNFILIVIDYSFMQFIPYFNTDNDFNLVIVIFRFLASLIWGTYFMQSKRVKSTFIN